jgi:hypothetical protein
MRGSGRATRRSRPSCVCGPAKHGATSEDRARLRITFAHADDADAKRPDPDRTFAKLQVVLPEGAA